MALVMTPIYTQTVGSGGTAGIVFNNIPGIYTDLKIVASLRFSGSFVSSDMIFDFDSGSVYSTTMAGTYNQRQSGAGYHLGGNAAGANATSNTFSHTEIYIPNYASSNFKSSIIETIVCSNQTGVTSHLLSGLYRSTSPITRIGFGTAGGGNIVQHSTITLYGIIRQGA